MIKVRSIDELAKQLPKSRKTNPVFFRGKIELHRYMPTEPANDAEKRILETLTFDISGSDRIVYMEYKGKFRAFRWTPGVYIFHSEDGRFHYMTDIEEPWQLIPRTGGSTVKKEAIASYSRSDRVMGDVPLQVRVYVR